MKRTAFIIIIAVASLSPTARAKTATATLSKERIDYAVEYDRCKSSLLGRVGDEMWVTDKAPDGSATLTDFSAFKGLRKGTKIRDVYLDGRLGGIPRHI